MPDHVESERRTRIQRIDPRLKAQGWNPAPFVPGRPLSGCDRLAVREYPTANGPADYALCLNGAALGVVEAKKLTVGTQEVLPQAHRYSQGLAENPLNFHGYRVPFLYATNGETIWFRDARDSLNLQRTVANFHSPEALREMLARDFAAACTRLAALPNAHPRLRPYQREANEAIEAALRARQRRMLIAMATGTGKTFTLVNQCHRLLKSGVAKRILFLVDRRALAAQAVVAFASFDAGRGLKLNQEYEVFSQRFQTGDMPEDQPFDPKLLPASYLRTPNEGDAFVYVCTVQRMAGHVLGPGAVWGSGDEPPETGVEKIDGLPIHAFDLIIADECHRGYTGQELSVWRDTIDYFDAIKIGLTATPAPHTTGYFGHPVYRYDYPRAVREGYLVDYDVVSLRSNVRMEGVFLAEGEQVGHVDPETGQERLDLLEDERQFEAAAVEERVTSPDSNQKILEEIKSYALRHEEETGRFPKTLIFAANDLPHTSHADQLVKIAREVFGRGQHFVAKITGRVDRPLQKIREFRNRPEPGVVVTVDLLSTGVDIPDLETIVFLRTVKSRILFTQMLGRGTRKGEIHPDKSHFTVFDCFDGTLLRYFRESTDITSELPEKESRSIVQVIEAIWNNQDREYNIRCLVKRLQRIDKQMSGEARSRFAAHIEDGDVCRYAAHLPGALKSNFAGEMKLLRNPDFQDLLEHYQRAPRTFVVAYEAQDQVSSEWLVRDADGREYRPEDYLAAFARFVKENPAQIDAIRILLEAPREWSADARAELRKKLGATQENFRDDVLQRVHQVRYQAGPPDIISMIKHAAREDEPLLTAAERVNQAVLRVSSERSFTLTQRVWLERMRKHLMANLSLARDEFRRSPVLSRAGGWASADRAFGGGLGPLLRELNEAIAG